MKMWLALAGSTATAPTDRSLETAVLPGDERPVFAAIRRLVEANACLGVTRAVRLAGSDVERLPVRVGRIENDRADRVRWNAVARRMPVRLRCQRVVGHPHATTGGADEYLAVIPVTTWINRNRRRSAGVDRAGSSAGRLTRDKGVGGDATRADFLPVVLLPARKFAEFVG